MARQRRPRVLPVLCRTDEQSGHDSVPFGDHPPLASALVPAQPAASPHLAADDSSGEPLATSGSDPAPVSRGPLSRQPPKVGAECVSSARSDLCGGRPESMDEGPSLPQRLGSSWFFRSQRSVRIRSDSRFSGASGIVDTQLLGHLAKQGGSESERKASHDCSYEHLHLLILANPLPLGERIFAGSERSPWDCVAVAGVSRLHAGALAPTVHCALGRPTSRCHPGPCNLSAATGRDRGCHRCS
jgi:hypothetical protein